MATVRNLKVEMRERTGTGGARENRRAGFVPGVVYGDNKEPASIRVAQNVLEKAINAGGFFTHLIDLEMGGQTQRVLAREVQFHPVKDLPQHVDFMRVNDKTVINIEIPVHVVGQEECAALKEGAIINMVRHSIELYVRANNIPEYIEISVAGLEMGDSIHISQIQLPAGAKPVDTEHDFTVLQVAEPRVEEEPAPAEAAAEGEAGAEGAVAAPAEGAAAKDAKGKDEKSKD